MNAQDCEQVPEAIDLSRYWPIVRIFGAEALVMEYLSF